MNASCQTLPPLYTPEICDQVIVVPIEKPPLILISEKEYLELKSEMGYWRAMHQKAILREKKQKETIKEQEGQIRDLRNRLFGKKSEKKSSSKDEGKSKPVQNEALMNKIIDAASHKTRIRIAVSEATAISGNGKLFRIFFDT